MLVNILDGIPTQPRFEIVPVDKAQADAAQAAFVLLGKVSGDTAQLNFRDLFSYALAKTRHLPLLFKSSDFAETDIMVAIPPGIR